MFTEDIFFSELKFEKAKRKISILFEGKKNSLNNPTKKKNHKKSLIS